MDNIYNELNQKKEDLTSLIEYVNTLNDKEIKDILDNEKIDRDIKTTIVEYCSERIKRLPFSIFLDSLYYIKNSYIFLQNYKDKINTFSKEELISLIYDTYLDNNCLIELTKMDIFKRYLEEEQQNKNDTKLQSFALAVELNLNDDDVEKLNLIGIKVEKLLENSSTYSEDIDRLINCYLDIVIEKYKEIDIESDINRTGIFILNYCLKNHKRLNSNMLKFYILFHLKELGLDKYCKKIILTEQLDEKSFSFGDYQKSTGRLRIFTNYLDKTTEFKHDVSEKLRNDCLNLMEIQMLSHEFGHIEKHREVEKFQSLFNDYEEMVKNTSIYGWYKNGLLRLVLGDKKYTESHSDFLEEVRADIFSIFDSTIQINKYFKNSFSEKLLQSLSRVNAKDIIEFYTEEKDSKIEFITPIEKFDNFF